MTSLQPTIVVVEDDPDLREVLLEVLGASGHAVRGASNGREALAELDRIHGPTMILLDLMMPVMNGFEFLEALRLRTDAEEHHVIIISAQHDRARLLSDALSVVAVVLKPFDTETLVGRVESLLAARTLGSGP